MESAFCDPLPRDLRVIETLGYDPALGCRRRDTHRARMAASCARLGIAFAPSAFDAHLDAVGHPAPMRLRVTVDVNGHIDLQSAPLPPAKPRWRLNWAGERVFSGDPWLTVKTTQRHLYDSLRADLPDDVDEVIVLNERDEVCEGTITNIFIQSDRGLITPPLQSGVLPGVLRQELIARGDATERVLSTSDIEQAQAVFVGNALRGLIPAQFGASLGEA